MSVGTEDDSQRGPLVLAYSRTELTLEQLWTRYFALGGDVGLVELEAYLEGLLALPDNQRDLVAVAVNERLDELVGPRVPYSRTVSEGKPDHGPLAALVDILEGARLVPPERLPVVAAAAGQALGVGVVVYLIDYDQRRLVPLSAPNLAGRESLEVDTTLAGRAFRMVEMLWGQAEAEADARLWVPLVDGEERLGVLEITLGHNADPRDSGLWHQCRWIGLLLGHLVTAANQYGDALDKVRLRQPRTIAAELVWMLLPPLTAGADNFLLAGMLEPSSEVGGDAFDYGLSEETATLAIFDAVGHTLSAGLMTAATLAAYRNARSGGHDLLEQAAAIDRTIGDHFGDDTFVTGVIAELELATGRLRYVVAGHPQPVVLRSGKVVKRLSGGHRAPFGVMTGGDVAQEILQPGDWLVLHTDGITEARDSTGRFFGDARLMDFLEREAASGHPPPETVRRLTQAVLDHQDGVLQDDATVLLARWGDDDLRF
ncbi:MAG TPA: PP2C family protein-serine/threonine phosphatase [Acidimicrobiales bacterium]|nr:PP2C family protein-serine/threonine phosphatase [Acidimicrobiales bacterium]